MKATTMIRMDHTHVLTLFHRFKPDTSIGKKRALVANACLALDIHAQLEEEFFYPALREVISGDEIGELRQRVGEEGPLESAAFDDKFNDLMRIVMHHVADEETRLLPAAERLLGDRLAQIGGEMMKRRVELLKPHLGELATSTMRSFPSAAAAGLLLTAGAVAVGAMLLTRRADTRLH
jgi:hemerythrin superfamily protein